MLVTDRYTGLVWDFYLQDRTAKSIINVLSYLLDFLKQNHELKPEVIECDNEITSRKSQVYQFIHSCRIKVEPSAPYTQSQNGGAERSGGVIKEKIRAMRGKLPSRLWPEISKSAVYLHNRTPKYIHQWKTPYELFYAKKPSQEHLCAYTCKAFAMITDALKKTNRLQRLNPKAWIGYLIGYSSTNIYRIWIPQLNKVISTRDVVFNEEERFTGDLEKLKDDVREVDLEELAKLLQKVALPENEQLPERESSTYEDAPVIPLDSDELLDRAEDALEPDDTIKFEPYPTLPATPPAALLADLI